MKRLLSLVLTAAMLLVSVAVTTVSAASADGSLISLDFESGELPSDVEFSGMGGTPTFETDNGSTVLSGTIYSDYRLLKIKNVTLSPNKKYRVSYKYKSPHQTANGKYIKIVADAGNGNVWSTEATQITEIGSWKTVVGYITASSAETSLNATVYFAFGTTSECNDKIAGAEAFKISVDDICMKRDNPVVFDLDFESGELPSNVEFSGYGGTPGFETGNGGTVLSGQIYSDYRLLKIKNSYLKPDTTYQVTYKYMCTQDSAIGKYVKIVAESGANKWSTNSTVLNKNGWNTVAGYITTNNISEICDATVYFAFGTTAECNDKIAGSDLFKISVDDIILKEVTANVIDFDFDDGVLPNRTEFSGQGGTPEFADGNGGKVLKGTIYSDYRLLKVKNVFLAPNTKYKLTYKYNCTQNSAVGKYVKIVADAGNGNVWSTEPAVLNKDGWNTVEGYITTSAADTLFESTVYFAFGTTAECNDKIEGAQAFVISVDDIVMTTDFEEEKEFSLNLSFKAVEDVIGVADVVNNSQAREIILYLAQYDNSGNLVNIKVSDKTAIEPNEETQLTITPDKVDDNADVIKLMAWDGSMVPYSGAAEY